MNIRIRDPVNLQHEIKSFIRTHYRADEVISFEKKYPETYQIYQTLKKAGVNPVFQVPRKPN